MNKFIVIACLLFIAVQAKDRLRANEALYPGDYLQSPNGRYTANYQTDGNFVIYTKKTHQALWAVGVPNPAEQGKHLVFQGDNNLVILNGDNRCIWGLMTNRGTHNGQIVLRNDGHLVVYDGNAQTLWTSPNGHEYPVSRLRSGDGQDRLHSNEALYPNEALVSPNGRYTADYQEDGNFVVYTKNHQAVWAVGVPNPAEQGKHIVFQGDNNLVILNGNNNPIWGLMTNRGAQNGKLVLRNDGHLVVYDGSGVKLWTSPNGPSNPLKGCGSRKAHRWSRGKVHHTRHGHDHGKHCHCGGRHCHGRNCGCGGAGCGGNHHHRRPVHHRVVLRRPRVSRVC